MKNLKLFLFTVLASVAFFSCDEYNAGEEVNKPSSVSFERTAFEFNISDSNPVFPLEVYATDISSVDRVVNLEVVAAETTAIAGDYTFSNSVTIPAGQYKGVGNITFNPSNIALGTTRNVSFKIVQPEGTVANITKSKTKINYTPLCEFNLVELSLTLDRYGSEISWEIRQGSNVLYSDGPFADISTNALQPVMTSKYCLQPGTYTFVINDIYGDGLFTSAAVQGSYRMKLGNTTLFQGGGNFGSSISHNFVLN